MSAKLSVEQVLANLERRAVLVREKEAFHAQQETHHREERARYAAELESVLQSLETFRAAAATAVDLARLDGAGATAEEEDLPAPGRLMVGRMIRRVVESPDLQDPFGPTTVAEEVNRRFEQHLRKPIGTRTASDTLRQMLAKGEIWLARKGKAFHEALYTRTAPRRSR